LTADRCGVIDGDRWLWQLWHHSHYTRSVRKLLLAGSFSQQKTCNIS